MDWSCFIKRYQDTIWIKNKIIYILYGNAKNRSAQNGKIDLDYHFQSDGRSKTLQGKSACVYINTENPSRR